MINKLNILKSVFYVLPMLIIILGSGTALAKSSIDNHIEINIFGGYFKIPNIYTFNPPIKKKEENAATSSFSQYEKINEPLLENPGTISMGHISECDICQNPSMLNEWNIQHKIEVVKNLTIISADVRPPGSKKSTKFIYIFDELQFIEFKGGNLDFIENSLSSFKIR